MADALHRRLVKTLESSGLTFELVFVDDACPEGSGRVIEAIREQDSRVRLLTNPTNLGQAETVRRGLAAAQGKVVVIMDADLQDAPEDIPVLLDALREGGVEAVFAGRRGTFQSPLRMATSRIFKRLMRSLVGVPEDAGSFVAMSRTMADAVLATRARHPYMLALIGATGLRTRSAPAPRAMRPAGGSAYSEWGRLRFALDGARAAVALRLGRWIRR